MKVCLPKEYADAIRKRLDSGEFSIEKLAQMSTTERRTALNDVFSSTEELTRKARKEAGAAQFPKNKGEIDTLIDTFNKGFEERIISSSRDLSSRIDSLKATINELEDLKKADKLTGAQSAKLSRSRTELADLVSNQEQLIKRQNDLLERYVERELKKATPKAKQRTIDKINKLNYLLEPGEEQMFLEDLVSARFGFGVTDDTRKIIYSLSKDSEEAIAAGRKFYEQEVPKVAEFYKKSHPEAEQLRTKLSQVTNQDARELLERQLQVDAENYAYDVLQGWRGIDAGAPITKADQVRIQKQLIENGLKSQRLVDFIGFQQRNLEMLKYSGIKDAAKAGELYEATQLALGRAGQISLEGFGALKSIVASVDLSVLLRQGLPVLLSNPKAYKKQLGDTFKRTAKIVSSGRKTREQVVETLTEYGKQLDLSDEGKKIFDDYVKGIDPQKNVLRAEISMRPNSLNGKYDIPSNGFGLNVLQEEAFPSSLPARIPGIGRAFGASEFFFEAASLRWRANLADNFIYQLERKSIDWTEKGMADELGLLVSSLTGRGLPLGMKWLESHPTGTKVLNNVFFSPRFTGSRLYFMDTIRKTAIDAKNPVQRLAMKQVGAVAASDLALMGLVHMTAKMFWGDEAGVEFKPDSPFFGHLKFGNYAYDMTGGMGSYTVLLGKMFDARSQMRYDPRLQIYVPVSWGETAGSTFMDFFMNKLSPGGQLIRDIVNGHTWGGESIATPEYLVSFITPLATQVPFQAFASNDGGADALLVTMAEMLGAATKDLRITPMTKEWKALKENDSAAYWRAVNQMNKDLWPEIDRLRTSSSFQNLSKEEQYKEIARVAKQIQNRAADRAAR